MLELRNLSKIYQTKTRRVAALDGVSFALPEKGFVFILGRSGSGKTTMLNMLGGLDAPTEGELIVDGVSSRDFKQADFDNYRNRYVGFVFQEYHLLDDYTVADNIALALELQGDLSPEERQQKIAAALSQVDLAGYGDRNTGELSGGQKQRVAIARALVKDPPMILADEPTGALDRKTGRQLFDLLKEISKDKLVVVVSHDEDFAHEYADRILELEEGKIIADTAVSESAAEATSGEKPVQEKTLSVKNALRRAFTGIKRRKVRFAAVSLLCTVAFLLVGAADLLAGYDKRTVLINSLYQQKPAHVSLRKETYLTYDTSTISPALPTAEALEWYQNQNAVKLQNGKPGWYGDYLLTEADMAEIGQRFGVAAYGVYVPQLRSMSLTKNYATPKQYERTDAGRLPSELTGFMELTEAGMEDLGLSLVAGRLPDGSKNEIAISKYLYEAFVLAGYSNYAGLRYTGRVYSQDNALLESISLRWNEYLEQRNDLPTGFDMMDKYGDDYGNFREELVNNGVVTTMQVAAPEDLIGKTLFIANLNYTITGIVDTHFDSAEYADIYKYELEDSDSITDNVRKDLIETLLYERKNGLSCLAFVGAGKTAVIAAQEPRALKQESLTFKLTQTAGEVYEGLEYTTHVLVDMSTLPRDIYPTKKESFKTAYISGKQEVNYIQEKEVLLESFQNSDLSIELGGNHTSVSGASWKIVSFKSYEYLNPGDLYWAEDISPLGDSVILHPYLFDLFTEGRPGIYSHCILAMPEERSAVAALVDASLQESNGLRYLVGSMVTDQLNQANGFLSSLADMTQYLGIVVAAFAMAVFAMFTILSIREKKQQIGIMRALGAGSRDVFAIFFTEGLLVAAISAVMATALTAVTAIVGSALLRNLFELRLTLLNFSLRQAVMIFALSFSIAIVASIIPILRIARKKPVDAIRKN